MRSGGCTFCEKFVESLVTEINTTLEPFGKFSTLLFPSLDHPFPFGNVPIVLTQLLYAAIAGPRDVRSGLF